MKIFNYIKNFKIVIKMNLKQKETKHFYPIDIIFSKNLTNKKRIYDGIEVYFPYEPYPPQEKYMEKIILTLKNKGNISALESPTGLEKLYVYYVQCWLGLNIIKIKKLMYIIVQELFLKLKIQCMN